MKRLVYNDCKTSKWNGKVSWMAKKVDPLLSDNQKEFDFSSNLIEINKTANPAKQIKYANDVNNQDLFRVIDSFTELENNLFYVLIAQIVNERDNLIVINTNTVKRLINYDKHVSQKAFVNSIDSALTKFLKIVVKYKFTDKNGQENIVSEHLFDKTQINTETFDCKVKLNKRYIPLFNNFKEWTRFSVLQYTALQSAYSKRLFRLLKQYRTLGKKKFTYEEFRQELIIPKSYRPSNINTRVLKTVLEELSPYFEKIQVTKEYVANKNGKGRSLSGYIFTWVPESAWQKDFQSKILEELTGYYNIKENPYLTPEMRFKAIDRFRGRKLGTTQKLYESSHPNTYFVIPAKKTKTRATYINSRLKEAREYTITQLRGIVQFYEYLNRQGKLLADDQKDLGELESILYAKQEKLQISQKNSERPYLPNKDTIASSILVDLTDLDTPEQVRKHIDATVIDEWAKDKRGQDNRLPEFKD